jgi:hypothetical protein
MIRGISSSGYLNHSWRIELMTDEISKAASLVLRALVERGKATVRVLTRLTGLNTQQVNRGVGWLAKEDRIVIESDGKREHVLPRDTGKEGAVSVPVAVESEKEEESPKSAEPK